MSRGVANITAVCGDAVGSAAITVSGDYILDATAACLAVGESHQFVVTTTAGHRSSKG